MVENDQRQRRQWLNNMGVRDVTDRIGITAIQIFGGKGGYFAGGYFPGMSDDMKTRPVLLRGRELNT